MAKLTNFVKKDNRKLKEHVKPIRTPYMEPSANTANNQVPLIAFKKRSILDVLQAFQLTPEKLT